MPFQSLHYKPKKISELNLKTEKRVSLLGKVVELRANSFVLSDKSGSVEIFSELPVESNRLVRVFCSVAENQLKADLVQSLNGFDADLFNRIEELYRARGL